MVGAGNIPEQTRPGNHISGFSGFSQVDQDVVGLHIDEHAGKENDNPSDKPGILQPLDSMLIGKIAQVIPVDKSIDQVEENGHKHDGNGHFLSFGPQPERENDITVDIMNTIQTEKYPGWSIVLWRTHKEKTNKNKQGRSFHDDPAPAVADHGSPFRTGMATVRRNRFNNERETQQTYGYP